MKKLPVSSESEEGVLGSVLIDPSLIPNLPLHKEDFYDPRNAALWDCLQQQYAEGKIMDAITIGAWLESHNKLGSVGGFDRLVELQRETLIPSHSQHYA